MPQKPEPVGTVNEKPRALVICERIPLEGPESGPYSEYAEALCDALSAYFSVSAPVRFGRDIWKHIVYGMPDAMIVSSSLSDVDAISFIKSFRRMTAGVDTAFFLCSPKKYRSLERIAEAERLAGTIALEEPAAESARAVYEGYTRFQSERSGDSVLALREYLDNNFNFTDSRLAQQLRTDLADNVLIPLGFEPELKGTKYLETIITMLLIGAPERLDELYSYIGEMYKTSGASVEKTIRYSIERAWEKGSPYLQYSLFGNTIDEERGKPTNKEFILTAAQHVSDRLGGRIFYES